MVGLDEDSLICDFAETYHIFNYKEFPLTYISTLAVGLRDNSRIKMKLFNRKVDLDTMLLAGILDTQRLILWTKTKDGEKNRNRPKSVIGQLSGETKDSGSNHMKFKSCEDFEKARNEILSDITGGEIEWQQN